MSETDPSNPLPRVKGRLPFEAPRAAGGGALKRGFLLIYAALSVLLIGVAVYMGWIENRPLSSPYVVAPVVGAFWFALRLFMSLAPRA